MKELKTPPVDFSSVVNPRPVPDEPNAARHAQLKDAWRPGQRWETLRQGCETWVPVSENGYAEPTWDNRQEYRMERTESGGVVTGWNAIGLPTHVTERGGSEYVVTGPSP